MKHLKNIDTYLLIEMLAIYTAEYTNMLSNNVKGEAFNDCEFNISRLQNAIKYRLQSTTDTEITRDGNNFNHVQHK